MATIKTIPAHIKEHTDKSMNNSYLMGKDSFCACYHCKRYIVDHELKETVDDGQTLLCPHCGIDAVIPVTNEGADGKHHPSTELLNEISLFMYPVS